MSDLFPGYFALVMATGIVSVAAHLGGLEAVAQALLAANLLAYSGLALLLGARLLLYPRRVLGDLGDHGRGPGFFTLVAGSCVLGVQLRLVAGAPAAAASLWWFGLASWAVIMYGFFAATIVRTPKPSLQEGINGAWLIATVATQSVVILGVQVSEAWGEAAPLVLFGLLALHLVGAMLYLTIITLIFYRFTFLELPVESLTPPYWINMGAVAISTLAGATLLLAAGRWGVLELLRPFLLGLTLMFWATATWWIPLLVLLGLWRHGVRRHPLRYDPQYWGMVFPLGMYSVATRRVSEAVDLPSLAGLSQGFVYIALVAWVVTAAGMLRSWTASPSKAARRGRTIA